MAANRTTPSNVLFYIPNIIGYLRVIFTLLSLTLMICLPSHWVAAILLYVASFVGDLFDGMAARKFDQCSTFGGLLDMVTDRCSTTGLLCVLSKEYADRPEFVLLFIMLIILDISSHWCQMYSTSSQNSHHKSAEGNKGRFFLVRWYYSSYPFFGYCCVGAEFTYVTIYMLSRLSAESGAFFDLVKTAGEYFLFVSVPACAVKQVVNVSQLCSSCYAVAAHDAAAANDAILKKKVDATEDDTVAAHAAAALDKYDAIKSRARAAASKKNDATNDDSWSCMKCDKLNPSTRKRCSYCLSWKAGVRDTMKSPKR